MTAIRIGFIGAGGYARVHIDGFLQLQSEGLVKIVALSDVSAEVLRALCGVPGLRDARCFAKYEDLLAMEELDAVVMSAPIPLHLEIAEAAINRGIAVLLEKPPVPLLSQLDRLIDLDSSGRVMVAFQHIYSDLIRDVKLEIAEGRIGKLSSISAHGVWPRPRSYYERAGWAGQLSWQGRPVLDGPCTNAFAHFVNLTCWLAAGEKQAFAMPDAVTGEVYRARPELPTYDTGCVSGMFDNGVKFFCAFSHASTELQPVTMRLAGTKGCIDLCENCKVRVDQDGRVLQGDDGSAAMRRAFVAFAQGDKLANWTPLRATKPYVLATNMMLLSSGKIHDIPHEAVQKSEISAGDDLFAVENIGGIFEEAAPKLGPLCGTGISWARRTRLLTQAEFLEGRLCDSLIDNLSMSPLSDDGCISRDLSGLK